MRTAQSATPTESGQTLSKLLWIFVQGKLAAGWLRVACLWQTCVHPICIASPKRESRDFFDLILHPLRWSLPPRQTTNHARTDGCYATHHFIYTFTAIDRPNSASAGAWVTCTDDGTRDARRCTVGVLGGQVRAGSGRPEPGQVRAGSL